MSLHSPVLSSRQHPLCKLVRSLHNARDRRKEKLFVAEGDNAVSAVLAAKWPVRQFLTTPDNEAWLETARASHVQTQLVEPALLEYLSDAQTAPNAIALVELPEPSPRDWKVEGCLLVLDGVSDPGNVGTLIRAADAAGAGGVLATSGSADLFAPKVVRASAGSLFHLPSLQLAKNSPADVVQALHDRNIPLIIAAAHEGTDGFEYSWPQHCALVLGHETRGVSPAFQEAAIARVSIPIYGQAESLNVAMAGTILLYAWRRGFRK